MVFQNFGAPYTQLREERAKIALKFHFLRGMLQVILQVILSPANVTIFLEKVFRRDYSLRKCTLISDMDTRAIRPPPPLIHENADPKQ